MTLAQCLPRVKCSDIESLPMGDGCTRIRVTMQNEGFLPSYACNQGFVSKAVPEEAVVTLALSDDQELMTGDKRLTVPHLEGRARSTFGRAPLNPFMANSFAGGKGWFVSNKHETRVEWVVKGSGKVRASPSVPISQCKTAGLTSSPCLVPLLTRQFCVSQVKVKADFARAGIIEVDVSLASPESASL